MTCYSIEPRTRKYVKGYGFLAFARNLSKKYGKQLMDTPTKTALDALKTASEKIVHKAAEARGEFIGNKITDNIVKPKPVPDANSRNVEEIFIKRIKTSIIKWNTLKYLNDSTVSKFVTRTWMEVNDLSNGQYSVDKSLRLFNLRFKNPMLRSDMCDYIVAYTVVKGTIDLLANAAAENDKAQKDVAFKNNAPFSSCT